MSLFLSPNELRARALTDLRMGVPVVADGHLIAAAETLDNTRLGELRSLCDDLQLVLTDWRAQTLKIAAYDGDMCRIALPAAQGARWVQALADPACDLDHPLRGPFHALRGGDVTAHRLGIALSKAAHLLPAIVVGILQNTTQVGALTHLPPALQDDMQMHPVSAAALPMRASKAGRVHVYRPDDGGEEHYAIEIGSVNRSAPVLARLHSACFTGDVLGSLKCDCGPQLHAALAQMGQTGQGILLYLNQEGRGIGLANKMRAYALQDQGFDTVEANHRLGFEDDERDFRIGAQLLQSLGITQVRLLTNNPAKVERLQSMGITVVERVPLKVGIGDYNRAYLATKAKKSGHLL